MHGPGHASSCSLWEALEKLKAGDTVRSVVLYQGPPDLIVVAVLEGRWQLGGQRGVGWTELSPELGRGHQGRRGRWNQEKYKRWTQQGLGTRQEVGMRGPATSRLVSDLPRALGADGKRAVKNEALGGGLRLTAVVAGITIRRIMDEWEHLSKQPV